MQKKKKARGAVVFGGVKNFNAEAPTVTRRFHAGKFDEVLFFIGLA